MLALITTLAKNSSPQEDVQKLVSLMTSVDCLLDRGEEIMQHIGRTILCWL
jgi:hypothetical protein